MRTDLFFRTRREFLLDGIKGAALVAAGGFVPQFLARTARAAGTGKDAHVLVVLQLSGGNDGLNTFVPYADDLYRKARPTLALSEKDVLKLDDKLAFHPAIAGLKAEYDAGRFALIENVGYPNPNRSHFRSMEIWHTASDANGHEVTGWIGRYFDACCSGEDPSKNPDLAQIGTSFGKVMPQAFRSRSQVALAVNNPETFRWNASGETVGLAKAQEAIFAKLNRPGAPVMRGADAAGGISGSEPETVDFLRHTAMNAVLAGDRIRSILAKDRPGAYPQSNLAEQFRMIAALIGGGFPSRVYYANQGGYDTHANQPATHARLLADVSESLGAFLSDLRARGHAERVLVMAFSEFGRRVAENGSAGTDHGAAAPMFLVGDRVKAGVHGGAPDLADLDGGDLRHTVDFRQVYASVLESWPGTDSRAILGREFRALPVIG